MRTEGTRTEGPRTEGQPHEDPGRQLSAAPRRQSLLPPRERTDELLLLKPLPCGASIRSPKQKHWLCLKRLVVRTMKMAMLVLDRKCSPAHSERVEPTGLEYSTCSTRVRRQAQTCPASTPRPTQATGVTGITQVQPAQVPCVSQPAWRHLRAIEEPRALQRPAPCPGEDGPQGALRPVSSSACPPPWGPQTGHAWAGRTGGQRRPRRWSVC